MDRPQEENIPRQDAGNPEGRSPEGSAAQAHSRAGQDAKRRKDMDAKQLSEGGRIVLPIAVSCQLLG